MKLLDLIQRVSSLAARSVAPRSFTKDHNSSGTVITDLHHSLPDFNKPGTLRVGTASKNKNMGTDLGKKRFKKSAYPNLQTKLFNTSK